jgi:hypothetical protein
MRLGILFQSVQYPQRAVEDGQRMRGPTGDVEIDGQDGCAMFFTLG